MILVQEIIDVSNFMDLYESINYANKHKINHIINISNNNVFNFTKTIPVKTILSLIGQNNRFTSTKIF